MVLDFVQFKHTVKDLVVDQLDHHCLNDILPQPSAENIAVWVWNKLKEPLTGANYTLYEVQVWETRTSGIVYRGESC